MTWRIGRLFSPLTLLPDGEAQKAALPDGVDIRARLTQMAVPDAEGDTILAGALDAWLRRHDSLAMNWMHGNKFQDEIIGEWADVRLDGNDLIGDGIFYEYIQRARETRELVARKKVTGVSLGFLYRYEDMEFVERQAAARSGFDIKTIWPFEASIVRNPAQVRARITSVRRAGSDHHLAAAIRRAMLKG